MEKNKATTTVKPRMPAGQKVHQQQQQQQKQESKREQQQEAVNEFVDWYRTGKKVNLIKHGSPDNV